MLKFSRSTAYGVQAVTLLAQESSRAPVACSKLAAEGRMPERFLLQILRMLVMHGILRSSRGVDGGYALARDPSEISLLELVEAIEGPLAAPDALSTVPAESNDALKQVLARMVENTRRELAAVKLSELVPTDARKNA